MHAGKGISVLLAVLTLLPMGRGWSAMPEPNPTNEPPLRLVVDLVEGSRLIGVPSLASIPVQTPYAKLEIALSQLQAIRWEPDRATVVLEMNNGDKVKGAIPLKALEIQGVFGKVLVAAEYIAKIGILSGERLKTENIKGLLLYYSFDKDENNYISDLSGKGNNGKLHGSEWMPRGKVGGARMFNGKNDYISIDYDEKNGLFPTVGPFSVAVWFKTSAAVPDQQVIIGTHFAGEGRDGYEIWIDARNFGGKAVWCPALAGAEACSQAAVNDDQWHQAVGVWDDKKSLLYLDGVLQSAAPAVGALVYSHRASFRIGHLENNNAAHARDESYYFKGALDEVMVFNRALAEEDVKALFNSYK
jgi:hypothetical protein